MSRPPDRPRSAARYVAGAASGCATVGAPARPDDDGGDAPPLPGRLCSLPTRCRRIYVSHTPLHQVKVECPKGQRLLTTGDLALARGTGLMQGWAVGRSADRRVCQRGRRPMRLDASEAQPASKEPTGAVMHHRGGPAAPARMAPLERLAALCDPGTLRRVEITDAQGEVGVVAAVGRVGPHPVVCYAQDS